MRFVESEKRAPSRRVEKGKTRKAEGTKVRKAEQKERKFETVEEPMKIVLSEAVRIATKSGEEYVLEPGDTLRVMPSRK